jgi:ribosomal-protein-alanine N-acetyltransferase
MHWWDVPAVHEIEQDVFDASPWSQETFISELSGVPDTRWYAVATRDDSVVGYVGLMTVDGDGDIQTLARARSAAGQGIGQLLLDAATACARERGCTQLLLEVRADNQSARDLYERNGFEAMARRSNYYGHDEDAVVMRLRFRGGDVTPRPHGERR